MLDLASNLQRLGLAQYLDVLVENGFDTWDVVLDITEEDLDTLGFKLGHRRMLQREIASIRGEDKIAMASERTGSSIGGLSRSPWSAAQTQTQTQQDQQKGRQKRRYRRRPRPDPNAPKRPKTAYVNFAEHLRTDPAISALSFVDIAKEVGRRWHLLPPEKKHEWECDAARALNEYEAQMDEYKRTDEYGKYTAYLEDFRRQQGRRKDGKRLDLGRTGRRMAREGSVDSTDQSSSRSPLSNGSTEAAFDRAQGCYTALSLAMSEVVALKKDVMSPGLPAYNANNLPPYAITRGAIEAVVVGTECLLFMWSKQQAEEALNRLYSPRVAQADPWSIAEACILAAIGGYYDVDFVPDDVRKGLYASCVDHFNEDLANQDYFRTVRMLLCLAFYSVLEKDMSARYCIAAGLQIARWKCPQLQQGSSPANAALCESWRKLLRSLIFIDCWLSYTLGYQHDVIPEDVAFVNMPPTFPPTIRDQIHQQCCNLALVAAEISKTLEPASAITTANVAHLSGRLDAWYRGLPPLMHLASLSSGNGLKLSFYERRAILMCHIMYLGATVLLYRRASSSHSSSGGSVLAFPEAEAARYLAQCAIAAQQMARILDLITYGGAMTKRCWLMIYWSFSAAVVLLFNAALRLSSPSSAPVSSLDGSGTVDDDLAHAKTCLNMLRPCCNHEPIAQRYYNLLHPLHAQLVHVRIHASSPLLPGLAKAKSSIYSLLRGPEQPCPSHGGRPDIPMPIPSQQALHQLRQWPHPTTSTTAFVPYPHDTVSAPDLQNQHLMLQHQQHQQHQPFVPPPPPPLAPTSYFEYHPPSSVAGSTAAAAAQVVDVAATLAQLMSLLHDPFGRAHREETAARPAAGMGVVRADNAGLGVGKGAGGAEGRRVLSEDGRFTVFWWK